MRGRRSSTASRRPADHATGFHHHHGVEAREQAGQVHRRNNAGIRKRRHRRRTDGPLKWLHGLSVRVSLAHIAVSGVVLARFV
ncbi:MULTISPECIES: hypothetical protein [Methyloversatilis]|uniref:hypothetical protein n=1 Tax=Methyloversatilis TaxID=378210 RepID=UPI0026EA01DF|nr:hypothetical protein [Methyloversatilis discipulorum]